MQHVVEGRLIQNYRILQQIGAGAMGEVYLAKHVSLESHVAVKILPAGATEELLRRFGREAHFLSSLSHPGFVKVHDFGSQPEVGAYILMEYLPGESLGERMAALGGRLPLIDVLRLGAQIADALRTAHQHQIVHRDIKPGNIMIVPDPQVAGGERIKVLDFGLARELSRNPQCAQTRLTRQGMLMGTPRYMAPEQCLALDTNESTDVYALGAMLFHLLTGETPFNHEDLRVVLAKHVYEPPPRLRSLDPAAPIALDELVDQMLRKEPAARPTMEDVLRRLADITDAEVADGTTAWVKIEPEDLTPEIVVEVPRRRRRALWVSAVLAPLALAVIVILGLLGRHWSSSSSSSWSFWTAKILEMRASMRL